jgi:hypothetical protein
MTDQLNISSPSVFQPQPDPSANLSASPSRDALEQQLQIGMVFCAFLDLCALDY